MRRAVRLSVAAFLLLAACSSGNGYRQNGTVPVKTVFDLAGRKLALAAGQVQDGSRFPRYADESGRWVCTESSAWSSGFFVGCLWFMYDDTGDETWRTYAEKWTEGMEGEQYSTVDHNNGFKMMSSFGNGYRLTGNEKYREVLVQSARSLASRFSNSVGMIKANDMPEWRYPVLIDTMVNIELLFWAAGNGGDAEWAKMAELHAVNSMRLHIRPDGSTAQVVNLNPDTGEVIGYDTLCGLSGDSAWSRGQGQAIYGFTMAYRYTKNHRLLDAAITVADYYLDHLPDDNVPYWDLSDPAIPDAIRDSSAASIAASGLLELSGYVDADAGRRYAGAAENILMSLSSESYLSTNTDNAGILLHATWKKPTDPQADTSLIWGDYNYLEALLRYDRGKAFK